MAQAASGSGSGTCTITLQTPDAGASIPPAVQPREEVVSLRLAPRRSKKVSWKAGTVDNELLNKKSSKKCCVFHKEHGFDSDDSEDEREDAGKGKRPESCDSHGSHQCSSDAVASTSTAAGPV